ncbi:MAG: type I-E CRISPR-associated protein Cse2/CasB [Azoarcus sp.]|jgi:CRISPR system Cascade subunit CasB|nr:type I-E CRISPR-associated protein Cse2/CasB [Azoarcus sp.]
MKFNKEGAPAEALYEWWEDLQEIESPKNQKRPRRLDRAGRATLRRCATIAQITGVPAYQHLCRRLQQKGWSASSLAQNDRLAAVAGLLAHVKEDDEQPLAKTMSACAEGSDQPKVSTLRFMRLLDSPDLETIFTGLRRVLPLMKHKANVKALAEDLIYWGDKVKKEWAYSYDWPDKSGDA